jgi:cephalosporin hydroxylase
MKNTKNSRWSNIPGWFDYSNVYDMVIDQSKPDSVFVEIGAWFGKSTAYMAQKIADSGKSITFYVVDTWQGSKESETQRKTAKQHNNNVFPAFWQNIVNCGLQQYIKPIQLCSIQAAKSFEDKSIDFVFIDASHLYEAVLADIKSWYPKIKHKGIIAGHDYSTRFNGVVQAVNEMFLNNVEIITPKNKLSDSWLHIKLENNNDRHNNHSHSDL